MILTRDNEYCAVLDTCVLAPMPLCDTLLRCAEEPALYRVVWSEQTLVELVRTLEKFGYSEMQARRRVESMRAAFPEASVAVPERMHAAFLPLPDAADAHVMGAAVRASAQVIVTWNLRHFPERIVEEYGVLVQSPDEFLLHQFHLAPERMGEVMDVQASGIGQRCEEILKRLETGLPEFVRAFREWRL